MTIEIDIDEARRLQAFLSVRHDCAVTNTDTLAPDFCAELESAISNYDEAAHDRQNEAYYGGDGAGQKQAAAFAAARKDAGR